MTYGCGAESCVNCYPFSYRCEHGVSFPQPVPNGQPVPPCEEIGCDPELADEADHMPDDGCAIYDDQWYGVMRDDEEVDLRDLEVGDVFTEGAQDPAEVVGVGRDTTGAYHLEVRPLTTSGS